MQRCDREMKPLFVFLHSRVHGDAAAFVRDAIVHPPLAAMLNRQFIAWAGCVQDYDGCEAAARLGAEGFPFVAVFAPAPTSTPARPKYMRVWAHEGYATGEQLQASLTAGCSTALTALETLAADRAARAYERQLREEQDR